MRQELTGTLIVHKRDSRKRLGFTLIEVVVASALLAAAIVPILRALTTAYATSIKIEQTTCSLMYAQAKLDEIKMMSIYNYGSTFAVTSASLGNSYFYKVVDASAGSDLRTITVSVGYDDNRDGALSNGEIKVALSTLIARRI